MVWQVILFMAKVMGAALFLGMLIDMIIGKKLKHVWTLFVISSFVSFLISFAISETLNVSAYYSYIISLLVWLSFVSGTRLNYKYDAWREQKTELRHKYHEQHKDCKIEFNHK